MLCCYMGFEGGSCFLLLDVRCDVLGFSLLLDVYDMTGDLKGFPPFAFSGKRSTRMDHGRLITLTRMLDRKFILYLLNVNLYNTFNHVVSLLIWHLSSVANLISVTARSVKKPNHLMRLTWGQMARYWRYWEAAGRPSEIAVGLFRFVLRGCFVRLALFAVQTPINSSQVWLKANDDGSCRDISQSQGEGERSRSSEFARSALVARLGTDSGSGVRQPSVSLG